jgi:hypothetical protein
MDSRSIPLTVDGADLGDSNPFAVGVTRRGAARYAREDSLKGVSLKLRGDNPLQTSLPGPTRPECHGPRVACASPRACAVALFLECMDAAACLAMTLPVVSSREQQASADDGTGVRRGAQRAAGGGGAAADVLALSPGVATRATPLGSARGQPSSHEHAAQRDNANAYRERSP